MKVIVNLVDGITPKHPLSPIVLRLDGEFFIVEEMGNKGFKSVVLTTWKVPIERIQATLLSEEKEFIEKSKSVIGRGVAGGLLFGPAGLVLGGMSGIGKKQKTKTNYLYSISYLSSDNELKNLTFSMPLVTVASVRKFDDSLKKELTVEEDNETNEYLL